MRIIGNDPNTPRQTQVVASGTLSTGDTVVVNSDGTVSVVEETSVSQNLGSFTRFDTAYGSQMASTYDVANNRVVISYQDEGNSTYGTAVVGTVSGTSISFGTPVVYNSASTYSTGITYDTINEKIVVVYRNIGNSSYGTARVGTVSGTSISFGSAAVYNSGITDEHNVATFDENAGKVVVVYKDASNFNYGTAAVGTVSGTSISFGSEVVFNSATTNGIGATYDSTAQKIVVSYEDGGSAGDYGTAKVGTVSGTSISFGSAAVFESAFAYTSKIAYDSQNNKSVVVYGDYGNNLGAGTAAVGTVSGTSISFGSPVVFESAKIYDPEIAYDASAGKMVISYYLSSNNAGYIIVGTVSGTSISFGTKVSVNTYYANSADELALTFDSSSNKIVLSYFNANDSNYGGARVFTNAGTSTNLTSENYIGTAKSGAANGDGVVVNTQGTVDDSQTGLTAGQSYYVQTDGTLSTTAGDPSVFAGTAVSATKLIVKG